MTIKGAREVLQHPIMDGITKALIVLLVWLVQSSIGDLNEIKQQLAVQGEQISSQIKVAETRSDHSSRLVALEIGSASKAELQTLRETMAQMNVEFRDLINARLREIKDSE